MQLRQKSKFDGDSDVLARHPTHPLAFGARTLTQKLNPLVCAKYEYPVMANDVNNRQSDIQIAKIGG